MNKRLFDNVTVDSVVKAMERLGYPVNKSGGLNIVNVRSSDRTVGIFNDVQILFYYSNNSLKVSSHKYSVTVDPGMENLINPVNSKGCAIVAAGHYPNVWAYGLHKGEYPALVQVAPITVIRDANKDNKYDYLTRKEMAKCTIVINHDKNIKYLEKDGKRHVVEQGLFGINCHRASQWKILKYVGLYSAGCVVHEDPNIFTNDFMKIIKSYVNRNIVVFSATWLDSEDLI